MEKKPVVTIENGKISGSYNADASVCIFKGIPYAASPEGERRFCPPQPVENWEGIRKCESWGDSAVQPEQLPFLFWTEEFLIEGTKRTEDCLNLNVWTGTDGGEKKQVLVYIHGGGFISGGSSCEVYDGEYLASQGIVYVSINYRLGALGFLTHPALTGEAKDGFCANYGILDQIAALKWVQKNIAAFGGDPEQVTIMGQSAGAASVDTLIASPLASGLFQRAVSLSLASAIYGFPNLAEAEKAGAKFFKDCTAEELREMPEEKIMQNLGFNLVVDGKVIKGNYAEQLRKKEANPVELMTGMVLGDGMLFRLMQKEVHTKEAYKAFIAEKFGDHAEQCLALYPAEEHPEKVMQLLQRDFLLAILNQVSKLRAEHGYGETYLCLFTHNMPGKTEYGAFHTADVPYFTNRLSERRKEFWKKEDYALASQMSAYLLNFVRNGNPNGENLPQWTASRDDFQIMELENGAGMLSIEKEKQELFRDFLKEFCMSPVVQGM